MKDPVIEQLEAELHESQFSKWDVETLLVERHRAKIERLERPKRPWWKWWEALKELAVLVFAYFGFATAMTMLGLWMLTGSFIPVVDQGLDLTQTPPALIVEH